LTDPEVYEYLEAEGIKYASVLTTVATSIQLHSQRRNHATEILEQVTKRLGIDSASGLLDIYRCLLKALGASYEKLVTIVRERI
jgi:hypothetical protein